MISVTLQFLAPAHGISDPYTLKLLIMRSVLIWLTFFHIVRLTEHSVCVKFPSEFILQVVRSVC